MSVLYSALSSALGFEELRKASASLAEIRTGYSLVPVLLKSVHPLRQIVQILKIESVVGQRLSWAMARVGTLLPPCGIAISLSREPNAQLNAAMYTEIFITKYRN